MIKRGDIILVDTTVIIGAYKYRCWDSLAHNFKIETVRMCMQEFATGGHASRARPPIDISKLEKSLKVNKVDLGQTVSAGIKSARLNNLDPGEKELLSHAHSRKDCWLISSQDAACIRVGNELGFLDKFVSLEEMTECIGRKDIIYVEQYTRKWLESQRTKLKMEEI